jgi:hypothetical protein
MFWVLLIFIFSKPEGYVEDMADRQVEVRYEPTPKACTDEAMAMLQVQTPDGVSIGVKCTGPFTDPTKTTLDQ